jgi:hypothetical protein
VIKTFISLQILSHYHLTATNTRLAWQVDLAWVQDALHSEDTALHDDEVEEKGEDEKLKELGLEQLADEADPET